MDSAYKVSNVQRRDEWKSRYSTDGQPDMVDYAITLDGESGWIKLSQKITTKPPQTGDELFGHIETQTTKNGEEYRKFKKASQQQGGMSNDKLAYIVQMLEELTGRRDVVTSDAGATPLDNPFDGLGI